MYFSTDNDVVLAASDNTGLNSWKIRGLGFSFEEATTLAANAKIVLFSGLETDVDAFRSRYGIDAGIGVYAYDGSASNSNEKLELLKSEELISDDDGEVTNNYSLSDQVHYYDRGDWPEDADGDVYSLVRKDRDSFGNCSSNWELSSSKDGAPQL